MAKPLHPLTQERLRELIGYDPETGQFSWRLKRRGPQLHLQPGSVSRNGYRVICLDYKKYFAHRIAWFYETGFMPTEDIDHINGNRLDNRWANLRVASRSENMQNMWRAHKDNKSCGLQGVTWDKQRSKWKARIHKEKRQINLGHYVTPDEAHAAYLFAKRALHVAIP